MEEVVVKPVKFFSVSTGKLVLLSVFSFGLYELYWFYRNWKAVRDSGEKVGPIWRTWLTIFYVDPLFKRVFLAATKNGFAEKFSYQVWALLYLTLVVGANVTSRFEGPIPDLFFLLSYFSVIPLIKIQKVIDFNNKKLEDSYKPEEKFSTIENIILLVGVVLTLLVAVGFLAEYGFFGSQVQ